MDLISLRIIVFEGLVRVIACFEFYATQVSLWHWNRDSSLNHLFRCITIIFVERTKGIGLNVNLWSLRRRMKDLQEWGSIFLVGESGEPSLDNDFIPSFQWTHTL